MANASNALPEMPHVGGFKLEPDHWYSERTLRIMGFEESALAKARKAGLLRCSDARRAGDRLYMGAWIQAWLEGREAREAETDG